VIDGIEIHSIQPTDRWVEVARNSQVEYEQMTLSSLAVDESEFVQADDWLGRAGGTDDQIRGNQQSVQFFPSCDLSPEPRRQVLGPDQVAIDDRDELGAFIDQVPHRFFPHFARADDNDLFVVK